MKNNKKAENLIWVVIAVFILSFTLLGIISITNFDKDTNSVFLDDIEKHIIYSNTQNIIKKLSTDINSDLLAKNEEFYIKKNSWSWEFQILTWTINENYKYVDKFFNKTDLSNETKKAYELVMTKKDDILRQKIEPPEIDNLIFHFDATNINWNNNIWINNWDTISVWKDLASSNWEQNAVDKSTIWQSTQYTSNLPKYNENGINNLAMIEFAWSNQLAMNLHSDINNDNDQYSQKYFMEKSFAIVFKTWDDIINRQVIYEQWWAATWYNFMIENGNVWAWIHNIACKYNVNWCTINYADTDFSSSDNKFYFEWDAWHKFKSVNLWSVVPNTIYFITIIQDSTHINRTHTNIIDDIKENYTTHDKYIDSENKLKIYLNGALVSETNHMDPQPEHSYWALWNIYRWNVSAVNQSDIDDVNSSDKAYFKWWIWELISRNHALNPNEIMWVQNYFLEKWLKWKKNINYDVVNTSLKKIINSNN